MNRKKVLAWVENQDLTQEDIDFLVDRLCQLRSHSSPALTPRVVMFLQSRRTLRRVNREEAASYLHMSTRTLSRKLKNEDKRFHQLLCEERKRRCLHYMRCNIVCGTEITELLGFSDISHFYKSFRQWTGMSFSEAKTQLAENHLEIDTIFHRHACQQDR